jgi:hypothetical protein
MEGPTLCDGRMERNATQVLAGLNDAIFGLYEAAWIVLGRYVTEAHIVR